MCQLRQRQTEPGSCRPFLRTWPVLRTPPSWAGSPLSGGGAIVPSHVSFASLMPPANFSTEVLTRWHGALSEVLKMTLLGTDSVGKAAFGGFVPVEEEGMTHPAVLGMERESDATSGLFLLRGLWEGKSTTSASQEGGVCSPFPRQEETLPMSPMAVQPACPSLPLTGSGKFWALQTACFCRETMRGMTWAGAPPKQS